MQYFQSVARYKILKEIYDITTKKKETADESSSADESKTADVSEDNIEPIEPTLPPIPPQFTVDDVNSDSGRVCLRDGFADTAFTGLGVTINDCPLDESTTHFDFRSVIRTLFNDRSSPEIKFYERGIISEV